VFCRNFVELFHELVISNDEQKEQRIVQTREAAAQIWSLLAEADRPSWLQSIMALLGHTRQSCSFPQLIDSLMPLREIALGHHWVVATVPDDAMDFDEVFERHKRDSKLGDLFDEVVTVLIKIAETQEVDSRAMVAVLRRLIATIQRSRNGSFSSMSTCLQFLMGVLENFVLEELRKIPILGSLVIALEKAVTDLQVEVSSVGTKALQELETRAKTVVPEVLYNRVGSELPIFRSPQQSLDMRI
jgi:hypothetical protein